MSAVSHLFGAGAAAFVAMTLTLFAAAAALTGQALARRWRPMRHVLAYGMLLALGDRFLVYALYGGTLLSLGGFVAAAVVLAAVGLAAFRLTQARRMVAQYPWLYRRRGLFGWADRSTTAADRS